MYLARLLCTGLLLTSGTALAQQVPTPPLSWPRTIEQSGERIEIYQPQIDTWQGDHIAGSAAVAIGQASGTPTFGVAHFSAHVDVQKDAGLVHLDQMMIDKVDIPSAPDRDDAMKTLLQSRLPKVGITAALDQLQTTYAVSQQIAQIKSVEVQNTPPHIIFASAPAALVLIQGPPSLHPLTGTAYQRVVNTNLLVLQDAKSAWFVFAGGHWFTAGNLDGPWSELSPTPAALKTAQEAAAKQQAFDPLTPPPGDATAVPALHVATEPTELVQTKGQPQLTPVPGTSLLEMRNADHAVFMETQQNRYFVLVSGRWFAGPALTGPWNYVASDALPADFAKIPPDDPMASALVSVAGTPQAREAVIASTIPQTATVDRAKASLTVTYAGAAQFTPVSGTSLHYATNTATPVIQVSASEYYAVSKGVWFVAPTPNGPWHVADAVPDAIYMIPPSSPIYYVTYVHVYRATPTEVVVGYTPGYLGVVVAPGGTVVYGTGYIYPPVVVGPYYYPYPATYGYGAGFALGAATGFAFGYAAGWCASPAWGPYWHSTYTNYQYTNVNHYNVYGAWGTASVTHASGWYGPTSWHATSVSAFNPYTGRSTVQQGGTFYNSATGTEGAVRRGTSYNARTGSETASRAGAAYNPNTGNYAAGRQGARYNPTTGTYAAGSRTVTGNAQTGDRTVNSRGAAVNPSHNAAVGWNNGDIYAGHDGNVYRRENGQWEQHSSNGWQPVSPSNQNLGALDQQRQARQLGQQRFSTQNWAGRSSGGRFRRGG